MMMMMMMISMNQNKLSWDFANTCTRPIWYTL